VFEQLTALDQAPEGGDVHVVVILTGSFSGPG
jgi:hypothetical protein